MNILRNPDERIENSLSVEVLWFEPMLERVSAGHTELFLRWRRPERCPEQNAQECGRENHDGDFTEIHWSNAPLIPYTKTPADCSAGSFSFSIISARHKVI